MSKILTVKKKNKTKQRERQIEYDTTSGEYSSIKEYEFEIVDVTRMTFVESTEVRLDEIEEFREGASNLDILDWTLDGILERSQFAMAMQQFHEFGLNKPLTLASKTMAMVEIPSICIKDTPLKIEDSKDVAEFATNAQTALDQRLDPLKEKQNKNDEFFSDFNENIREESVKIRKEIEDLLEKMEREGYSSLMKLDPPDDDEEDIFQISEEHMQAEKEITTRFTQQTKKIRGKQNEDKALKMSSLEHSKQRTTQNEKIISLKSERVKQLSDDAKAKFNATQLENEKLHMEIEEEKKLFGRERDESKELEKEGEELSSHSKKQEEDDNELKQLLQKSTTKLEELNAEDSRAKEEQTALDEEEKELEAHKHSLFQEFTKTDITISDNWTKSVTIRRKIHMSNVEISELAHKLEIKEELGKDQEHFNSKMKEVRDLEQNAKLGGEEVTNKEVELQGLDEQESSLTKGLAMDEEESARIANDAKQATAANEEILEKMRKLIVFKKIQSS